MDLVPQVPEGRNEPVLNYAEGSRERSDVIEALTDLSGQVTDVPLTIGGQRRTAGGDERTIVAPHSHELTIGTLREATNEDVAAAVAAAKAAAPSWQALEFQDRAAVLLKAADLLAGPWRARIVAATMLGQSKTVYQAEIDAACELIDFWRFNVEFAVRLLADQPASSPGVWNRLDYRPLDGFVTAITPFNFTAIAGNLPTAPALMGNTVVWKPSEQQSVAAQLTMELLEEAGLPPGVINLVTGTGRAVSEVALTDPDLAGVHFTGSTATFQHLWSTVGQSISRYHAYPRIVGETGGKDFVIAHPSADVPSLRTALVRGAFEYQGQKCSAASRAYIPRSLWRLLGDEIAADAESLTMGTVTDLSHFMGAVIDKRAYDRLDGVLGRAQADSSITVLAGGSADDTYGYFVRPTLLVGTDPTHEIFTTEYFGPILGIYVYDDDSYDEVLAQAATVAPYALTGSIFAQDRTAIAAATSALRFAAGNFYINDKPTGAVVGQQPFGGSRASGTNDKAGSMLNLTRWVSPRTIKETFVPPTVYRYPHMD